MEKGVDTGREVWYLTCMAKVVYEQINEDGSGIREWDDGEEEVFFSEAEWEVMMDDPKYGYICAARLHRMTDADHRYGGCLACEFEAEDAYGGYENE